VENATHSPGIAKQSTGICFARRWHGIQFGWLEAIPHGFTAFLTGREIATPARSLPRANP
jgi:hypothetical protein